jgi:predicted dehydrogenase
MGPRIGIVGTGFIAVAHARMLKRSTAPFERGRCFDIDRERSEAFASRSGWTVATSVEEVLDTCDAVFVTTWTSQHRNIVIAAAERGLHVFCEKPLATNMADAESMVAAVERSGATHQAGLVLRWSPAFVVARSLATEAAAGPLMAIVLRDDQYFPIQGRYGSTWRADFARSGGGVLIEHSVHDADLIEWIAGPIASVRAHIEYRDGYDRIDDTAVVTFVAASGAVATLATVWHDNLSRESNRRLEVICRHRMVTVGGDDWFGPVTYQDGDGGEHRIEGDALVELATAILGQAPNPDEGFVRSVAERRPAMPDLRLALRAQRLIDAAYRSANSGRAVTP